MCKDMEDILDGDKCKQLNENIKNKALLETDFKHNEDIRELKTQDRKSYLHRREAMRRKLLVKDKQFK
eukprot:6586889-Ditylum_brightwellii.AAC.1